MTRNVQGALVPPLATARPRRADVYRKLRDGILDGTFAPGARLPSTRALADEYAMSRTTLEDVFEQLVSEGLIVREIGRGSFVGEVGAPRSSSLAPPPMPTLARRGLELCGDDRLREPEAIRPFNAGLPDAASFPWRIWERCHRRAHADFDRQLLNHSDTRGYAPLRQALARYLTQFRGVRAHADQVLVFSSTSQALHACFLLLVDPGQQIWVEDPGYPGARAAAALVGAKVVPVPVDDEGICVAAGKKLAPRARLAYVTPAHQYPTGAMLTLARRRELLAWAEERDAVVFEDDYDADFRYHGEPLTTLQAMADGHRVFYVGTLSKAVFLGLRVAYAVVPAPLVERLANLRAQLDSFPAISVQLALRLFLDEGHLATHVRQMRRAYAEKRAVLLDAVAPLLARGWQCGPTAAGMSFILYEPRPGMAARVAATSGLALTLLSHYALRPLGRDGLALRFGGLSLPEIVDGARQLCAAAGAAPARPRQRRA
jgi:GntR family transcriptional regulator / MocR family aminotransferase